jgi:hypothetical protein
VTSPGERFGHLLGHGLTLLWTQGRAAGVRRWLGEGTNPLDTGLRWVLVGGPVALAAGWLAAVWWRAVLAAVVVCLLALRAATKAAVTTAPKAPAAAPQTLPKAAADDPRDLSRDEFVDLARDLIGDAPGVHLAALATALGPDHSIADVRALAERHQVPVRPSVRDADRRVSPGVHRADLPPLPEPLPGRPGVEPVGVVVAGQPGTTSPTTPGPATPTTRTVGGVRVTSTPDADNPHRTHVHIAPAPKRA